MGEVYTCICGCQKFIIMDDITCGECDREYRLLYGPNEDGVITLVSASAFNEKRKELCKNG